MYLSVPGLPLPEGRGIILRNKNVEKYTLKAPFGTLKQACETDVSLGGPDRTRTCHLLSASEAL